MTSTIAIGMDIATTPNQLPAAIIHCFPEKATDPLNLGTADPTADL